MKLTSIQIALYIIFIICVLLISYYYTNTPNTPNTYNKESFTNTEDTLKLTINNDLDKLNVTDNFVRNKIYDYISSLSKTLNNYSYLDSPITVNNNGYMCDNWGMYENGKYKDNNNNCIAMTGETERKCLSNNALTSCSNYYNDNQIETLNTINITDILNSAKYNIMNGVSKIASDLIKSEREINNVLDDLISKRNLENQQLYFINYNNNNLDDKQKILEKSNKDIDKTENKVNINKIQFQQAIKSNITNDTKISKYYSYIKWLIILIIFVGILNFFFSEIL